MIPGVESEDLAVIGVTEPDRESDVDSFTPMSEGEIAGIAVGTLLFLLCAVMVVLLYHFNHVRFGYWYRRHRLNGDFCAAVFRWIRRLREGIRLGRALRAIWMQAAERRRQPQGTQDDVRPGRDIEMRCLYPDLSGVEEAKGTTLTNQNFDLERADPPVSQFTRSKTAGRQSLLLRPRAPPPALPDGASRISRCSECGLVHDLEGECFVGLGKRTPRAAGQKRVRFNPYLRANAPPWSPSLTAEGQDLRDLTAVRRFAGDAGINLRGGQESSARRVRRGRFAAAFGSPTDSSTPNARRSLNFEGDGSIEPNDSSGQVNTE